MKNPIMLLLVAIALGGCAHQDLKAPCAGVISLAAGSLPCDQHAPINTAVVPSIFAQ